MRISDWSSDVCSSDLIARLRIGRDRPLESAIGADEIFTVGIGVFAGALRAGGNVGHRRRSCGGWPMIIGSRAPHRRAVSRAAALRSEEHTSALPSLMRTSYAVFFVEEKQSLTNN